MDVLAFIIMTMALMALVIGFAWYVNYYVSMNLMNTASYVSSLVVTALKHEFETAVSIASFSDVVGSFNLTLMMPTSSFPTQGLAINYAIVLYSTNESGVEVVMANVTVTASLGPITRVMRTTALLYSSSQPYSITAYYCNGTETVLLTGSTERCYWTSSEVQLGEAVIGISKG